MSPIDCVLIVKNGTSMNNALVWQDLAHATPNFTNIPTMFNKPEAPQV